MFNEYSKRMNPNAHSPEVMIDEHWVPMEALVYLPKLVGLTEAKEIYTK